MQRSETQVLTTHTGRLERPEALTDAMAADPRGSPTDEPFERLLRSSVVDVIREQADVGIDVVSDGEFGRLSWSSYLRGRLDGFEQLPISAARDRLVGDDPQNKRSKDRRDFADYYAEVLKRGVLYYKNPKGEHSIEIKSSDKRTRPTCAGPIKYTGQLLIRQELDNIKAALKEVAVKEAFVPSTAPGSILFADAYYAREEDYLFALADAMREEYLEIIDAGLLLHIDDPVSATAWDQMLPDIDENRFYAWCEPRIAALNHALRGIPEERVRVHVCFGSGHGPHSTDPPMRLIAPLMQKMNVGGYVIEASNARHEHEWSIWRDIKLPPGRVLIPGVIGHTSDTIEHPDLVAWRIGLFANVVGRENVIAGTDCGLGYRVHTQIAWAKLKSLVEGARIASRALWGA